MRLHLELIQRLKIAFSKYVLGLLLSPAESG